MCITLWQRWLIIPPKQTHQSVWCFSTTSTITITLSVIALSAVCWCEKAGTVTTNATCSIARESINKTELSQIWLYLVVWDNSFTGELRIFSATVTTSTSIHSAPFFLVWLSEGYTGEYRVPLSYASQYFTLTSICLHLTRSSLSLWLKKEKADVIKYALRYGWIFPWLKEQASFVSPFEIILFRLLKVLYSLCFQPVEVTVS